MNRKDPLSDEDFSLFQDFLVTETGLYFENAQDHSLLMALQERRGKKGHASYKEYFNYLNYHPEARIELRELLVLITTGETHFFRNAAQFEVLMRDVLPDIISKKKDVQDRTIRIWSAGSSKGDEAYSAAIAVMEVLAEYRDWNIKILGTDINRDALALAREAVYNTKDLGELPLEYVEKYFVRKGSDYILIPEVKALAGFQNHNLVKDPFTIDEMLGADIIFCRNVTIYFTPETTRGLIGKFYNSLGDGGYLFLGHSETLWQIEHHFRTVEYPHTFIYKKEPKFMAPEAPRVMVSLPVVKFKEESAAVPISQEPKALAALSGTGVSSEPSLDSETSLLLLEATYLYRNKQDDEALARLDRIVARNEGHIRANFLKAVIFADKARYDEAVAFLSRIVKKDSLNVDASFLLATLYAKTGKFSEGEAFFRRVIYLDADEPLVYFHLGNMYAAQKKNAKAVLEFRNAIRLLEKRNGDDPVKFGEDLTSGVLLQACKHNLAPLLKSGGGGVKKGSNK